MQNNDNAITEVGALKTLIKLSRTAVKRSKEDEHTRHAVLAALDAFGSLFLPPEDFEAEAHECDCMATPYEMAYIVLRSTKNDDLKALWYIFYPYLVVSSPYIDEHLYEHTKELLWTDEVFAAVLYSRYRRLVYDCGEDLLATGLAGVYLEWYAPYTDYKKQVTENGDTREIAQYKRLLALGEFDEVIAGTERLLNQDPYDVDVALLNIAARVSMLSVGSSSRERELNDTIEFIDGYLNECDDERQLTYLHYYRALSYLGLTASGKKTVDEVKDELKLCLSITEDFELAKFMLAAIDKKISETE